MELVVGGCTSDKASLRAVSSEDVAYLEVSADWQPEFAFL